MRNPLCFWALLIFSGLGWLAPCAIAADAPTSRPISRDSSIDDILDALDARGKSFQDLSADLKATDTDPIMQDTTIHNAKLLLQKKGEDDARVKIQYSSRQKNSKTIPEDRSFFLDNGKLIERDYKLKKETSRQVIKPGQPVNLFKLGEGQFPLPIGQKKEDVKAQFDVTKIDPAKDDPANSIHLQLKPKASSSFAPKFQTIDIWIDPALQMPIRIETVDRSGATDKTTDLSNVKVNPGLTAKDFDEPVLPPGWETHDEPYGN